MERCRYCGMELPRNAQFCGSCGRMVDNRREMPTRMVGYQTVEQIDMLEMGPTIITRPSHPELSVVEQGSVTIRPGVSGKDTPLPPVFNDQEDEDEEENNGVFVVGQLPANGVPMVPGTPALNGVPMVPTTPPLAGTPPSVPPMMMPSSVPNALPLQRTVPNSWPSSPPTHTIPSPGSTGTGNPNPGTGGNPNPGTGGNPNPGTGGNPNPGTGGSGCVFTLVFVTLVILVILGTIGGLFFGLPPAISLVGSSTVVSGGTLHLQGSHFVPGSNVTLLLDGSIPLFANGNGSSSVTAGRSVSNTGLSLSSLGSVVTTTSPASIKAGGLGSFDITLPVDTSWSLGQHTIRATESIGGRSTTLTFTIEAAPAKLVVKPQVLDFGKLEVGTKAILSVVVNNGGQQPLNWQASVTNASWLSLQPASGTIQSNASSQFIYVTGDTSQLKVGIYTATLQISSSGGTAQVSVKLEVTPASPKPTAKLVVTPTTLDFGSLDTGTQLTRSVQVSNTGTAALKWTADTGNASWVTLDSTSQTIQSGAKPDTINVTVDTTNLSAGTQTATLTINSNGGKAQVTITVVVNVPQQPCALQAPSPGSMTFSVNTGANPQSQSFTASVTGNCTAGATITPTVSMTTGSGWLAVSPSTATVTGGTTTFAVNVTSSALSPGTYTGSISLAATSNGTAINGSSQTVSVSLTVTEVPPVLSVSPGTLSINVSNGDSATSYPITITNTGGSTLNWSASLDANTPSFVTLSTPANTTLTAGDKTSINLNINPNGQDATKYSVVVTITATDPITGQAVSGSPATTTASITITAQPSMQVSPTTLTFTPPQCTYTASSTVTITNTGGGTLKWNVAAPVYPSGSPTGWLTVTPSGDGSGNATLTFSVVASGTSMTYGQTYTATVTITPSVGSAQVVSVSFTVPYCIS